VIENLNRRHGSLRAELSMMQKLADRRLAQVRELAAKVRMVKSLCPRPPNAGTLEASSGTSRRDAAGVVSELPHKVSRESLALPMAEAPPAVPEQALGHVGDAPTELRMPSGEDTQDTSMHHRVRKSMRHMKTELPNQMGIWCLDPILNLLERIGIKEYIILTREAERRVGDGCIGKIVTHSSFERTALGVILVHVAFMGVVAQEEAKSAMNHTNTQQNQNWALTNLEQVFLIWYIVELALRLSTYRLNFFFNAEWKWNLLDLFCVVPIHVIVESMMGDEEEGGGNFSFARILRILKMTKILRVARVMRFFYDLRLMMQMIFGSVPVFLWTLVMLLSILYVFSIIFLQGLEGYLADPSMYSEKYDESLKKLWGQIGTAMISLFMALTGGLDWRDAADPLTATGEVYYALFLFYIAILYIAILNVLIGMFCESAAQVASQDEDAMILEESNSESLYKENVDKLFKHLDKDGSREITYSEFCKEKDDTEVRAILNMIGLDDSDADRLFNSLGGGDDNTIHFDEFVKGCKEVKGDAKRRQLMELEVVSRTYKRRWSCFMGYVEETMLEIYRDVVRSREAKLPVMGLAERFTKNRVPFPGQPRVNDALLIDEDSPSD